jgi:MFS family permease
MAVSSAAQSRQSFGFLLGMSSVMLGANLVWVSYNSVLLPTLVENVVTQGKGLVVGLIGFIGTVVGITVNILAGIISDHTTSRWGKRTPAILIGALICVPLIGLPSLFLQPALRQVLLPVALPMIIFSFCGTQLATNTASGAWWPLLVDLVPGRQRGIASGIQGFMTLAGSAIAVLAVTSLTEAGQTDTALWLVGSFFAISGLLTLLFIRNQDRLAIPVFHISLRRALRDMFRVKTRVIVFFWVVFAVMLAYMGINGLQFFMLYFFQVYFPTLNPSAAFRTMGAISIVATMLAALAAGALSDRIGRRTMIIAAMLISAVTTSLMGLVNDFGVFILIATLHSAAAGPIIALAPALASELAPPEEAGQYMAYYNLSNGVSGALAGLLFSIFLVTLTRSTFTVLFIVSALLYLLGGIVFLVKVPQKELDARIQAQSPGPR